MAKRKRKQNRTPPIIADLDIVIPVYGRFDMLERCLASIPEATKSSYKITIYDDNSPDKEEADAFYKQFVTDRMVKVIRGKKSKGFPGACNTGVSAGHAPLVFLLNSDVVLSKGSLDIMIEDMKDQSIGVVGMKLLFPDDSIDAIRPAGKIQHVGLFTNVFGDIVHSFIGWSPDNPRPNAIHEAYAVTGAALLTRRALWRKVGGLFTGYGRGTYEDVEYCLTIRALGYKIIVEIDAVATHYVGASASQNAPFNLRANKNIFMSRWARTLKYTDWEIL